MITLLMSPEDLAAVEAEVTGDAYRHLFRARRIAVGDRLRVVDGHGAARWAQVAAVDRRRARLTLGDPAPSHEPERRVELLVAAHRKERASWLVEKVTELGVAAVRFLQTERTPREFGDGTFERLRRVAAAAVEQCHRARLPEITGMHSWDELPERLQGATYRSFLDAGGDAWHTAAGVVASEKPIVLLVGPEGGWTGGERDRLLALGCRPLSLGSRVLRVETAALAGATLVLCR